MKPTREILPPTRELTPFQMSCQREVERLLRDHGLSLHCTKVDGEDESYLVIVAEPLNAEHLKIYIYEDEAGFFRGDDWYIWELPDHRGSSELMRSFLDGLGHAIRASDTP